MRFAAVISHPIQHYSPIFSELARRESIEVKVFYLTDHGVKASFDEGFGQSFQWDVPLTDGHAHEFVAPGTDLSSAGILGVDAPGIPDRLDAFKPDLVWLHGYGHRANWRVLRWARNHCKIMYFGDSELLHERSLIAKAVKQPLLRWFFSKCDAFMTIGDNNEAYYRHYGVPEEKMIRGACPVDMKRFRMTPEQQHSSRAESRARFGIPDDAVNFVFSGKFQDYKRPLDLVEAMALLSADEISRAHLTFIGDGPLRGDLDQRIVQLGLLSNVTITGFVNQAEVPQIMAGGDVIAVTSERDAHPLTVTEALPFSMPVIASDKVGCVGPTDTARPGKNALVYSCGNIKALAEKMALMINDPLLRGTMGRLSAEIAPSQDITAAADAVEQIWGGLKRK